MAICICNEIKIIQATFSLSIFPLLVFCAFRNTLLWGAKKKFEGKEGVANGPLTGGISQTPSAEEAQLGFSLSTKSGMLTNVNFIRLCLQGDFQIPVDLVKNLGVQHLQKTLLFRQTPSDRFRYLT